MIRTYRKWLTTTLALLVIALSSYAETDDAAGGDQRSQNALESIARRGIVIRYMAICGDQKRANENGPRDEADLNFVLEGVSQGSAECEILLANWSVQGTGVPKDIQRAKDLYLQAADNAPRAYIPLGQLAEADSRNTQSLEQAFYFYSRAAEAEIPKGQIELGRMYEHGIGVERNLIRASELYRKASIRSDEGWRNLDRIQSESPHLTDQQIAEDRGIWRSILIYRITDALAASQDLAILNEDRKARVKLTFIRESSFPNVTIVNSSGNETFDAHVSQVLSQLSMPPAPIYTKATNEHIVEFPIHYQPPDLGKKKKRYERI